MTSRSRESCRKSFPRTSFCGLRCPRQLYVWGPKVHRECESVNRALITTLRHEGDAVRYSAELAEYEKLQDQVKNTAEGLRRDGFGSAPLFRCLVVQGEDEDQRAAGPRLVGYALSFFIYSTWEGRSLHLEDLYIMPEYRGKGIGSKLFSAVAESCLSLGCSRLQLSVLDWNHTAISFYRSRGARDLTQEEGWRVFRFIPEDLKRIISKNSN
ncbi:thialysine N-epsilon-acetyltransferase-like isoform X2 [Bufo bufo]|uniref:thialysine N-epsilon-acetyltransferase-like isoform X2 n=1 Tax=Bufo bufo TaxID=8384 RepID=UPI001ABEE4B9|nr:thialysine N-epsilon-acetyltransferase-like isoform X2 [Bufo bufo]